MWVLGKLTSVLIGIVITRVLPCLGIDRDFAHPRLIHTTPSATAVTAPSIEA